jgi:DNA-binding transcriptional regulator GbsR (MarR family)
MSRKTAPCTEQLKVIERRLAAVIANFGYLKGRSAKTSEVMAYIYIQQEVTQQLLRELTGYSLGTISAALQDLEKLGVVSKHPSPNSRGYVYRLAGTPSQLMSRSMTDFQSYLSEIRSFLKTAEAKLSKPSLSKKKGYNALRRFLDEMNVLIPAYQHVLQKFQTHPSAIGKEQGGTADGQRQ